VVSTTPRALASDFLVESSQPCIRHFAELLFLGTFDLGWMTDGYAKGALADSLRWCRDLSENVVMMQMQSVWLSSTSGNAGRASFIRSVVDRHDEAYQSAN
jgi:hypothetical protein